MRRMTIPLVAAALLLAGCSATPTAEPTPTPTTDPNLSKCAAFEGATESLVTQAATGASGSVEDWHASLQQQRTAMDTAGLEATGEVQTRMLDTVAALPRDGGLSAVGLAFTDETATLKSNLVDVGTACKVAGYEWSLEIS